ncbi:MAG: hypothetical protein JKP92_07595, partial [Alphaproteobacteria bacterium]|nr:hypothetical protein [Alphaproteobacteria bacterium]
MTGAQYAPLPFRARGGGWLFSWGSPTISCIRSTLLRPAPPGRALIAPYRPLGAGRRRGERMQELVGLPHENSQPPPLARKGRGAYCAPVMPPFTLHAPCQPAGDQ